ncbi:unnamed protein product, partial [marine sediment metagenome]
KVIPQAFNKSNALTIIATDRTGLENTLGYISKTFPYFDEYRDGKPQLSDVPSALEDFFKGEGGSAEAYFNWKLKEILGLKGALYEGVRILFGYPTRGRAIWELSSPCRRSNVIFAQPE